MDQVGDKDLFLNKLKDATGNEAADLLTAARRAGTLGGEQDEAVDQILERLVDPYELCSAAPPVFDVLLDVLPSLSERNRGEVLGCAAHLAALFFGTPRPEKTEQPGVLHELQKVIDKHAADLVEATSAKTNYAIAAAELLTHVSAKTQDMWRRLVDQFRRSTHERHLILETIASAAPTQEDLTRLLDEAILDPNPAVRFTAACLLLPSQPAAEKTLAETSRLVLSSRGPASLLLAQKLSEISFERACATLKTILPQVCDSVVTLLLAEAGIKAGTNAPRASTPAIWYEQDRLRIWWSDEALQRFASNLNSTQKRRMRSILSTLPSIKYDSQGRRPVETNLTLALD
jgi:hypothetical protein